MKKSILIALALIVLAATVQAQIKRRGLREERIRTAQGIRSGEITKGEAVFIHKQADDVRLAKRVAKADGRVSPREKMIIAQERKQLDRAIRRSKHNSRKR